MSNSNFFALLFFWWILSVIKAFSVLLKHLLPSGILAKEICYFLHVTFRNYSETVISYHQRFQFSSYSSCNENSMRFIELNYFPPYFSNWIISLLISRSWNRLYLWSRLHFSQDTSILFLVIELKTNIIDQKMYHSAVIIELLRGYEINFAH